MYTEALRAAQKRPFCVRQIRGSSDGSAHGSPTEAHRYASLQRLTAKNTPKKQMTIIPTIAAIHGRKEGARPAVTQW